MNLPLVLPADKLIASLVPRIGLTSLPWLSQGLPLGASRFGGPADLPPRVDWPTADQRPLLLLAQLNFGDLSIVRDAAIVKLLPKSGWLCLFLDVEKGAVGEVHAIQFDADPRTLMRNNAEPAADAEIWTQCHAVTVFPADHHLCLPDIDAVESMVPAEIREEFRQEYDALQTAIELSARVQHDVTLLGSPTLLNPDIRLNFERPDDWMLLLEFKGVCPWLAGVRYSKDRYLCEPSFGSADYIQYFVRKSDYYAGRLALGRVGYMLS